MNPKLPTCDLRIETLVYGGEGLGHLADGRAAFVPFVLPDELVKIRISEDKGSFVRGELVEVVKPSPLRVKPKCRHFGVCGGCQYQHMHNHDQVNFKKAILREQLQRLGKIQIGEVGAEPDPSPAWQYRNSLQFHLSPRGKVGFQRAGSNEVVEIEECHLPCTEINEIWPQLEMEALPGLERIELRSDSQGQVLLSLHSRNPSPPDFSTDLPLSAVHLVGGESVVLAGSEWLTMQVMDKVLRVSAGAFFQVNPIATEAMVKAVMEMAQPESGMTVVDAYCGVGLFSTWMAPQMKRCIGIESSPAACRDYAFNLDEFSQVELYEGLTEEVLPLLNVKAEVVIADPPRSGIAAKALQAILRMEPQRIVYVSCNPATLARDAKILASNGYEISQCRLVDMFPQTSHMEAVVLMSNVKE